MGDPWQDEGFSGADDDWDEGEETMGSDGEDELGQELGDLDDDGWTDEDEE